MTCEAVTGEWSMTQRADSFELLNKQIFFQISEKGEYDSKREIVKVVLRLHMSFVKVATSLVQRS